MSEQTAAELERIVESIGKGAEPLEGDSLTEVAEHIARIFAVKVDEVAILATNDKSNNLRFLVPAKLKEVGTIPITSPSALAARTARAKRSEIINNFIMTPHARVFEGVPLGGSGDPIQKIMSVPISVDKELVGVIQISRKGLTGDDAGPDFTQTSLRELQSIAGTLGELVQRMISR